MGWSGGQYKTKKSLLRKKTDKFLDKFHAPATEVAGELPVSLVNTACIFQVLVPVVFVGKYLPTSLTLVAFPCR